VTVPMRCDGVRPASVLLTVGEETKELFLDR
jgi:hypothetical protein